MPLMTPDLIVMNDAGRRFAIRAGQTARGWVIEFYDYTYANDPRFGELGQFICTYYAHTLRQHPEGIGIDLMGHEPNWKIDRSCTQQIHHLIDTLKEVT